MPDRDNASEGDHMEKQRLNAVRDTKKTRSLGTLVSVVLLTLTVGLSITTPTRADDSRQAPAEEPMPFLGSIQGGETAAFNADVSIRTVDGSGTGRSTLPHLRRFRVYWGASVITATGRSTGHYTFQAANGDRIFTELIGYGEAIFPNPGPPTHIHIVEHNIITGGTGRFARATGSFTLDRAVDVSADPDPFSPGPFPTAGSFHGTITSGDAKD
jgi:hypothetical protein